MTALKGPCYYFTKVHCSCPQTLSFELDLKLTSPNPGGINRVLGFMLSMGWKSRCEPQVLLISLL